MEYSLYWNSAAKVHSVLVFMIMTSSSIIQNNYNHCYSAAAGEVGTCNGITSTCTTGIIRTTHSPTTTFATRGNCPTSSTGSDRPIKDRPKSLLKGICSTFPRSAKLDFVYTPESDGEEETNTFAKNKQTMDEEYLGKTVSFQTSPIIHSNSLDKVCANHTHRIG